MFYLVLLNEESRASQYGIGTYVRNLVKFFYKRDDFYVYVINCRSLVDRFSHYKDCNIEYFEVPNLVNDSDSEYVIKSYYMRAFYLLYPFISHLNNENIILQINYFQHSLFLDYFDFYFPKRVICFTIHYFNWCLKLKGNSTYYLDLLCKDIAVLNDFELNIIDVYKKEIQLFNRVDKIICLSYNTKDILCNIYNLRRDKISVIYNGISDNFVLLNSDTYLTYKRKYKFDDNDKLILFVGRLDEIKGLQDLIKVFKILLNKIDSCRLVIIGDGCFSYFLKLCDPIWSKVTFIGKIDMNTLYDLYKIADVGVLLSYHEQCSFVAIEMMMHGIPLIVSTSTGLSEMVEDGVTGYKIPIYEYNNYVILDDKILEYRLFSVLNDTCMRNKMSRASRMRYNKYYTFDAFSSNMLKFYV